MEKLSSNVGHAHFSWGHILFLSSEIPAASEEQAYSLR